jgi:uncharacterized protein with HEPN domain
MSDAGNREWRFYIDDMIEFAEKILGYTESFDQGSFIESAQRRAISRVVT